jgi:hypothetical protein
MSQLMESTPNRGLPPANTSEILPVAQQQSIDIIKVLWRWKWLPILGALIGAGVGFMFYSKMPEQFQSIALVQVSSSVPATSELELYDPEKVAHWANRGDESRAIKSQKVLALAVQAGNLGQYFPELSEIEIVMELMDEDVGVEVQPAERSERATTQQLYISYVCEDKDGKRGEKAQAVVDAVIRGYQEFLADEYREVDRDVIEYFTNTEQRLKKEIDGLKDDYEALCSQKTEVLWNVDQPVDPYFESYIQKKNMLEQIAIARIKLKSTIQQVDNARNNGRASEDILMMLSEGSDFVRGTFMKQLFEDPNLTGNWERESDKMERTLLVQLQVREQELLRSLGPNHPSVVAIRGSIEAVEKQIEAARENELRALQDLDRNYAKKRLLETTGKLSNNGQPATGEQPVNGGVPSETGIPSETGQFSSAALFSGNAPPEINGELAGLGQGKGTVLAPNETSVDGDFTDLLTLENMSDHVLQMNLNALIERERALGLEEEELYKLAEGEKEKSQELQQFLRQINIQQERIESMKQLLASFSEKVSASRSGAKQCKQKSASGVESCFRRY